MKYLAFLTVMCLSTVAQAGRLPAPAQSSNIVAAKQSVEFKIPFEGDVFAQIEVTGHGPGTLDCELLDSTNVVVAVEMTRENSCAFLWIPAKDETFTIRLINSSAKPTAYHLETN